MTDVTALELELAVIAGSMAVVTAFLIKWAADAPDRLGQGVVLFLLTMMASMSGAAAWYYSGPSNRTLIEAFSVAGGVMLAAAAGLLLVFLSENRRRAETPSADAPFGARPISWPFLGLVAALVLLGEFLMGWAFQLATAPGSLSGLDLTTFLSGVLNSPWFLFTMAAEMGLTTVLLRKALGKAFLPILGLQALIMFLSPTALPRATLGTWSGTLDGQPALLDLSWVWVSSVVGSAAMIVLIVYLMEHVYHHPEIPRAFGRYSVLLLGVYGMMMAGLYVWLTYGDARLFGLSVVCEMLLYLGAVLSPRRFDSDETFAWQLNSTWAFELMSGIFLAEIFMGSVLDLVVLPQAYAGTFPDLPLSGSAAAIAYNAFGNGFVWLADVTGSTWFLGMMGLEMGALVVFKMRESKNLENRIRMGLMLASYAAFATFFPSWYYSNVVVTNANYQGANVPVLGWSMGIGTLPIGPSIFVVLALTYLITGVLCFLFGRRVICSLFCTAPLMYQGTTIDAMKTFNRHTRVGRKYLGSKLSNLYVGTTGVVMGSLLVASFLSWDYNRSYDPLTMTGMNLSIWGYDPTAFLFALYFGILWYLMFVAIPYVGNYNCVTMGWCYTGTIAQFFQKLGPYKLKVRDKAVCKACTTIDCAKACPVALVDMPGFFRTKGEYRSSKCCGVGNCVGACPYGNLYIYDIRHWVAERTGRAPRVPSGMALKVLPTSPAKSSPPTMAAEVASSPGRAP